MSKLRLNGSTSGYAEITAPAVAANNTITLPSQSGSIIVQGNSAVPVVIGSATSTGTASQRLQVTGGAYVSGNTGIGTTNPQSILHLQSSESIIRFTESDATTNNRNWNVGVNGQTFFWQALTDAGSGGGNQFKITRSAEQIQTFEGQNSGVTWFTINNDTTRVGIGTTNPTEKLDVRGTVKIGAATGDAQLEIGAGASGNRAAYVDFVGDTTYTDYGLRVFRGGTGANTTSAIEHRGTGELRLIAHEATSIAFWTTGQERARLTSNGRFGILTSSPSYELHVAGNAAAHGWLTRTGTSGAFGGNKFNIQWTGSNARLWIDATDLGNISISSDYRIKKNIQSISSNCIDRIKQLRPVQYEIGDYGTLFRSDGVVREGFIAHEVQEVIPSAAEGEKDEENRIQNLRTDAIVAVLTRALQEAIGEIESLKACVAALESQ